jgi:hypothetical protein
MYIPLSLFWDIGEVKEALLIYYFIIIIFAPLLAGFSVRAPLICRVPAFLAGAHTHHTLCPCSGQTSPAISYAGPPFSARINQKITYKSHDSFVVQLHAKVTTPYPLRQPHLHALAFSYPIPAN